MESCRPECPRVGYSYSPSEDPVRFAQNPSLIFAPSTIEKLQINTPEGVPRLFVHLFGLFGPNGPLPPHVTVEQAKNFTRAVLEGDPHAWRMIQESVKKKVAELTPG